MLTKNISQTQELFIIIFGSRHTDDSGPIFLLPAIPPILPRFFLESADIPASSKKKDIYGSVITCYETPFAFNIFAKDQKIAHY